MKKIFILTIIIFITLSSFAQRPGKVHAQPISVITPGASHPGNPSAKTTAAGDTVILQNSSDTLAHTVYSLGADSGYVTGTDYWGDRAFAEHYNVSDSGRNVQVVGVMALFGGKVNTASTKTITFNIWDQGAQQLVTGSQFYAGFPNNVLDSLNVPITHLGIGTTADTVKAYFFPTATGNLSGSFFVGYGINYNFFTLGGDTIGLASTYDSVRKPTGLYTLSFNVSDLGDTTLDTTVNVQNATLQADNIWYDNYTQDDSLYNNLAIYPIVITGFPVSTKGITRNNFTFFGNYPNPADKNTTVKFSLTERADVTIQVMDMGGRVLNTTQQKNLVTGEHLISLSTTNMPDGDYLYFIRTSAGDGIAGKMMVMH